MTYQCPLCGDYEAPNAGAVKAHITGAGGPDQPDNPHSGESGPEYSEEQLTPASDSGGDDDADGTDDAGEDAQDTAEQDSDEDSADRTPQTDAEPEQPAASTDGGSGIVPDSDAHSGPPAAGSGECPMCGSEDSVPVDAVLEMNDHVPDETAERMRQHESVCRDCEAVYGGDDGE